jgi:hypothetical protein
MTCLTVQVPDQVVVDPNIMLPFRTKESVVEEVFSKVIVQAYDAAKLLASTGTYQNEPRVPVARLKLKTDFANVLWSRVRLERIGGSQDATKPYGRNSDVKQIRIFKDSTNNDLLDTGDQEITYFETKISSFVVNGYLYSELYNQASLPFDVLLESTVTVTGALPVPDGSVYVTVKIGDELMSYNIVGTHPTFNKPFIRINSRARMGTSIKPHSKVDTITKVDMFNVLDDNSRSAEVYLTNPQLLAPEPQQTYFVAYDIGENAIAGNSVGVQIRERTWFTVPSNKEVVPDLLLEEANGVNVRSYPFISFQIRINPVYLYITAENQAPAHSSQGTVNVPLLRLNMKTDRNYVMLKSIKVNQTGFIEDLHQESGQSAAGQGDLSNITIWKDANSDGVFNMVQDVLLGSSSGPIAGVGIIQLSTTTNGVLITSTNTTILFIAGDIGEIDLANNDTSGHTVGVKVEDFTGLSLMPETGASDIKNKFPYESEEVEIFYKGVPPVPVRLIYPTVWADPFGDGFPAIDTNADGRPDRIWMQSSGITSQAVVRQAFVDIDSDGVNDLKDLTGSGIKKDIDLEGDGKSSVDLDGDGKLDYDFDDDGYADALVYDMNGDGLPEIDLKKDGQIDFDYIKEVWTNDNTKLYAQWGNIRGVSAAFKEYNVGIGSVYNSNDITMNKAPDGWLSSGVNNEMTIGSLSLISEPVAELSSSISKFDTAAGVGNGFLLTVESADSVKTYSSNPGILYVGSEMMQYSTKNANQFYIIGRGLHGTRPVDHPAGTKVSSIGYYFRVRAISRSGYYDVPGIPVTLMMFRVDITPPSKPGKPYTAADAASIRYVPVSTPYYIKWDGGYQNWPTGPASDPESGVKLYEVQEKVDGIGTWKTVMTVPGRMMSVVIGDNSIPSNTPRAPGHVYYYRIRAMNNAGSYSDWSLTTNPVQVGDLAYYGSIGLVVMPNPYVPYDGNDDNGKPYSVSDENSGIIFFGVTDSVRIQVYTIAGELVWDKNFENTYRKVRWDGRNNDGIEIVSGVYYIVFTGPNNVKSTTKLCVIR